MSAKLIAAAAVLALMLTLCVFATKSIAADTERMRTLSHQAQAAIDHKDLDLALRRLNDLGMTLDSHRARLEILTAHSAINEVSMHLAQARAFLLHEEVIQASSEIAALNESLTVLYELQRLSWSNLL